MMPPTLLDARYLLTEQTPTTSSIAAHDTLLRTDVRVIVPSISSQLGPGPTDLASAFFVHASLCHPNLVAALDLGACRDFGPYYTASFPSRDPFYTRHFTAQQLQSIFLQLVHALDYLSSRAVAYAALSP